MIQNTWFDPFFIFENLSEEDKLIQKNVKQQKNLIVLEGSVEDIVIEKIKPGQLY